MGGEGRGGYMLERLLQVVVEEGVRTGSGREGAGV